MFQSVARTLRKHSVDGLHVRVQRSIGEALAETIAACQWSATFDVIQIHVPLDKELAADRALVLLLLQELRAELPEILTTFEIDVPGNRDPARRVDQFIFASDLGGRFVDVVRDHLFA